MSMISSVAFIFVTACPPPPAPTPPTPDAADSGGPSATCEAWCSHAADLKCEAAKPTAKGATCTVVCLNVQNSGVVVWNLRCRVAATSCALADECEKGK